MDNKSEITQQEKRDFALSVAFGVCNYVKQYKGIPTIGDINYIISQLEEKK